MLINFTSINESANELMRMSEALEGSSKIAELIRLAASQRLPEFTAEDYRAMFRACDYLKDLSDGLYKAHENITALANARVADGMQ